MEKLADWGLLGTIVLPLPFFLFFEAKPDFLYVPGPGTPLLRVLFLTYFPKTILASRRCTEADYGLGL